MKPMIDNAIQAAHGPRIAEPAFSGVTSFMRQQYSKECQGKDVVILGVPFDGGTSNRPGARFAPRAIREASAGFDADIQFPSNLNPFEQLEVIDFGDCFVDFSRQQATPDAIYTTATSILQDAGHLISIGGDHSVSFPLITAQAEKYGPLAIIQIDAHGDAWDDAPGRVSHGNWLRKAATADIVRKDRSIQIGIRTYVPEDLDVRQISAYDADGMTPKQLATIIREHVGDASAYLTFDVDGIDPAFAPGTGTPVSGGLGGTQMLHMLWELRDLNWCGMDVVEVCPPHDTQAITALYAATIIQHYLQILAFKKSDR